MLTQSQYKELVEFFKSIDGIIEFRKGVTLRWQHDWNWFGYGN